MELKNRNTKIYLLAGKARHGKTTSGKILREEAEARGMLVANTLIAKYLKEYATDYFGWDGKEETKPRELLQQLGTDIIRVKLNKPDFFVDRTIEDIEILSYFFDVIIIDDIRFENEINKIKSSFNNVKSIKIERSNFDNGLTEAQKNHSTEIALDNYKDFDYTIYNDSSLYDLRQKITNIIKE